MTEPVCTRGGRWYRSGTADEDTWQIVSRDYRRLPIDAGDTVLDLGANIGAFTILAISAGADRVIAVEPEPECCAMWRRNAAEGRAELVEAAVAAEDGTATLWASSGRGTDSHSLIVRGPTKIAVEVKTVAMSGLLDAYRPQVVKCDIEGGEYALGEFWAAVPGYVEALAAELHFGRQGWREQAQAWHQGLLDQGFTALREPKFGPKLWNTVGIWARGTRT